MNFKLKAWMVYLISLVILPWPTALFIGIVIIQRPLETSLAYAMGNALAYDMIIGGFILGMYYSIKHEWKKWKKRTEPTLKDNVSIS